MSCSPLGSPSALSLTYLWLLQRDFSLANNNEILIKHAAYQSQGNEALERMCMRRGWSGG